MKYYNNIYIFILSLAITGAACAGFYQEQANSQGFYEQGFHNEPTGTKGFWNYEVPKPKKSKEDDKVKDKKILPEITPPSPLPSTEVLMKMHPDHIQILVKIWRKHAIHTLEPQDVSESLRIQDVARKKAAAYAAVAGLVNQTNPDLSLADEVPITNAARQAQFSMRTQAMNEYLHKVASQYGLLYFSSETCQYCRIQDGVLEQFLSEFDFDIDVIDFDKNAIMAGRFKVKQTPSIIIVNRVSKKHFLIAVGATSLPVLKENIYRATRYIQEEIIPMQFYTNEKDINTGLDPANTQN